jgi:hypothetical protein
MSSLGRGTFLGGLAIAGFLVLLFGGIWFFTPAPHRDTTMKLPYRHAAPPISVSDRLSNADVILVAGGCGAGFHRGAYGYCVPNGPMVGPPVAVGPHACPPGYYLGPHGRRCWPMGGGPPPGYGPPPPGYGPPPPGYGPRPPGEGPSAGYAPPRRSARPPPLDQNSSPSAPPGESSPSPGPETGPPPNE